MAGYTVLMYTANGNQSEAVALLVDHGVHGNQLNFKDSTALMFASQVGNIGPVTKLLGAGAAVATRNTLGSAARDFAVANGHDRMASLVVAVELQERGDPWADRRGGHPRHLWCILLG